MVQAVAGSSPVAHPKEGLQMSCLSYVFTTHGKSELTQDRHWLLFAGRSASIWNNTATTRALERAPPASATCCPKGPARVPSEPGGDRLPVALAPRRPRARRAGNARSARLHRVPPVTRPASDGRRTGRSAWPSFVHDRNPNWLPHASAAWTHWLARGILEWCLGSVDHVSGLRGP